MNNFFQAIKNKESIINILKRAGFQNVKLIYDDKNANARAMNRHTAYVCKVEFGNHSKKFKTWGEALGHFSAMFGKL